MNKRERKVARGLGELLLHGVGELRLTRVDVTSQRITHVRRPLVASELPLLPPGWLDQPAIDLAGGSGPGIYSDE